ncbi:hypothetical protein PR202_ga18809 [Eleusine coracana subsp. coracana]|uniref:Leucine-rich repeat-containing N-terminal plant-type domain-containing protein n=1 Tax=Eleusine coracana subsp. coracana TaxID=191504 RepID=A0AAV5CTM2_ELECO|nr:hypothetical protein PR202_ga18809 [Eleusine coracana subsp. coracana]
MGAFSSWGSSLSLLLCVLPFTLRMFSSSACFVEERSALMYIKSSLISVHAQMLPDSWGRGDDCCTWERVVCNNSTRRISRLDLSWIYWSSSMSTADDRWYLNFTVFSAFHDLEFLDLSWNSPTLISLEGSDALTKLRYLNLSGNGFGGSYLPLFSKFTSLEVLVLNGLNNISGGLPPSGGISDALSNASSLIALDIRYNQFMGNLNWVLLIVHHQWQTTEAAAGNRASSANLVSPANPASGPGMALTAGAEASAAPVVLTALQTGISGHVPGNINSLFSNDNEFFLDIFGNAIA